MILVLIFGISASFAANANQTDEIQTNDNTDIVLSVNGDDTISSIKTNDSDDSILLESNNDNKLTSDEDFASYDELNYLIKLSDNEVTLTKDYKYKDSDEAYAENGIVISKAITIDGNGHTLDGANLAKAFTINANNVILKNINIVNIYTTTAPITWNGDNGQFLNSNFSDTLSTGTNLDCGGGIYWSGNNAKVSNCIFNNTCGSKENDCFSFIKFVGVNFNVEDSMFINTYQGNTIRMMFFVDSSAVGQNTVKRCKFINCSSTYNNAGILFCRATEVTLDNCDFINCTSRTTIVYSTGFVTLKNCYFENNSAGVEVEGGCEIYDTTFKNVKSGNYVFDAATKVIRSTFINHNPLYVSNTQIINSTFENMKKTIIVTSSNPSVDIEGCIFKNNEITANYLVDISKGSNNLLKNNTFNNNVAKLAIVNIGNNIPCIVEDLTFVGNSPVDIINNGVTFDDYSRIYVSDTLTADTGLSRSNPTTLTDALSKIKNGGTIIIINGTHDLMTGSYSFYCNILGENNVIINIATFTLSNGYNIEKITFNQTRLVTLNSRSTLSNSNFTNVNGKSINNGLFYTWGVNVNINDCNILGSDFNNKDIFYYMDSNNIRSIGGLELDGLNIIGCNKVRYVFTSQSLANNNLNNINIINSNFSCLLTSNYAGQRVNAFNSFNNINIENCNLANSLFWTPNSANCGKLDYSNIVLKNVNYTGTNPIFNLFYNQNFNNIDISDLNIVNPNITLFKVNNVGNIIGESEITKVNNCTVLFDGYAAYTIDGLKITNLNANIGFNTGNQSSLGGLDIDNCKFSTYLGTFNNRVALKDSVFRNFEGILWLNGEFITLNNATFYNGKNSNGSSIVYINNESIFLDGCTFERNTATNGGAVYIAGNSSQIINSRFISNTATTHGGAIFVSPHVYYYVDDISMATISGVYENEADTKLNTLYRKDYEKTYDIIYIDSSITDQGDYVNSLSKAFMLVNPNGKLIFITTGQSFNFEAGSPSISKSNVTVTGKNTILNIESHITVSAYSNLLTFENIIFQGAPDHAIVWTGEDGKIINCTFQNNGGEDAEYGAALDIEADNLVIRDTKFINNLLDSSSALGGGAIYFNASGLTIDNCIFTGNMANTASHIYTLDTTRDLLIKNSKFSNGVKFNNGGTGILLQGYNTTISNTEFENNEGNNGGAIYLNTITGKVTLDSNKFTGNTAVQNGGAIAVVSCPNLNIINNNFTSNSASKGGSLFIGSDSPVIQSSRFVSNSATDGGAIYNNGILTVTNSNFNNNIASNNGGAIYSNHTLTLTDANFNGNSAKLGGALYLDSNSNTLNNILFESNTATVEGSAIYVEENGGIKINGITVRNNVHPTNGYDVYFDNDVSVDVPVTGLTLGSGQRIYYGNYLADILYVSTANMGTGTGLSQSDATTLTNALNHIADGGRIILLKNTYTINPVTISSLNNVAIVGNGSTVKRNSGNYIFLVDGSSIAISDLTFDGGIQVNSGSSLDLNGVTFTSNGGSGIVYASGSTGSIRNSKFTSNTNLNHLVTVNGAASISNSEFSDNTVSSGSVYYASSATGTVSNSLFDNEAQLTKTGNINYGSNEVISVTFAAYTPSSLTLYLNDENKGTMTLSSKTFSKTVSLLPVGNYELYFKDNNGNTYTFDDDTFTVNRLSTVYISPSGTGSGNSASSPTTWDKVADIITTTGTVVFATGTYSNFYGKTINQGWTLQAASGATPVLDANNKGRIFTVTAANVKINGLTFKNGKVSDSYGSAIHWTGTGGTLTNSVLTQNTGRPVTATTTLTMTNNQLKDQITLTKSNINWAGTETITGTFAHNAPSTVNILFNGTSQGSYTVSSSKVTGSYAFTNPSTRSVGSYVVTDLKNIYKEVL